MSLHEGPKFTVITCDVCIVRCTSARQLHEHVLGNKHRATAERVSPGCLLREDSLQSFFDIYLKLEPVVGLEFMEELRVTSAQHTYKCLVCGFQGKRKAAFLHVTGGEHIAKYLEAHHPAWWALVTPHLYKPEYPKVLQAIAKQVCEKYGRKRIKEISDDPRPKKAAKPSSHRNPARHLHRSSERPEREGDRRQGRSLRFTDNGDFLDYLQRFEIQNDEDAELLKRITQNCTQALVRFREKDARRNEPPHQDPPTGKGKADLGNAAPTSQDVAIQQFFNSIKNMEESEVVRILRDIAATNPAFRSIDVHNVIKYLQATGRVKTS